MSTVEDAVLESRENIPLQKGRRAAGWCCSCNEEYFTGSKFINLGFASFTAIITAALLLQIYYGDYQIVPHGSVATDSLECSKIGTRLLKNGGNAVDAAIGSTFCLAVVTPHLTSLDGGGQVMVYNHRRRGPPEVVDFSEIVLDPAKTLPRLVIGLAYLHERFATLPWKELVQPAADLARQGFLIPKMLVQAVKRAKVEDLYGHLEPGQLLQLAVLASTLEKIASIPEQDLYEHLKTGNQPLQIKAVQASFNEYDVFVPNRPSIGPDFLTNLVQLQNFNFTPKDTTTTEYIYRVAEVTQNLYEERNISTRFHEGVSTNVAAIDLDDTYVSLTTGLYDLFGSGETTTGGYIVDVHARALSCSRLPVIVTDASAICGRRLVTAANDMITTTQLVMSFLVANENLTSAIEAPRFHILTNGSIGIEGIHTPLFNDDVLKYLETLTSTPVLVAEPYMSSNVVEKIKDDLNSHSDSRGGGIASRF